MRNTREFLTLTALIVTCFLLAGPAQLAGQQTNHDQAALTLKQVKERLKQNKQYLKEAEKRGKAGDTVGLQTALNNYDRGIEGLNTAMSQGRFRGTPAQQEDAYNRVQKATGKHLNVLNGLLSKVPSQAAPHIQHAIDVSQKGQQTALSHLTSLRAQQRMAQGSHSGFGQGEGMGGSGPSGGMGGGMQHGSRSGMGPGMGGGMGAGMGGGMGGGMGHAHGGPHR